MSSSLEVFLSLSILLDYTRVYRDGHEQSNIIKDPPNFTTVASNNVRDIYLKRRGQREELLNEIQRLISDWEGSMGDDPGLNDRRSMATEIFNPYRLDDQISFELGDGGKNAVQALRQIGIQSGLQEVRRKINEYQRAARRREQEVLRVILVDPIEDCPHDDLIASLQQTTANDDIGSILADAAFWTMETGSGVVLVGSNDDSIDLMDSINDSIEQHFSSGANLNIVGVDDLVGEILS